MKPLMTAIFSRDPYEGFDAGAYECDLHGWGSEHPVFEKVLAETRPRLVIEVGTWKGASAVHMARCLGTLGLEAEILCIDTWLGAVEFWGDKDDPQRYLSLRLKNGYPTVYYQFLANVVKTGFREVITPFPQTSQIAARWLRKAGTQAQAIYIDGSHEEEDVLADLVAFWPLLAHGGILFGDDYDQYWPGVRSAVRRFGQIYGLREDVADGKWIVRKPGDWRESPSVADELRSIEIATATRFEVISEQLVQIVHGLNAQERQLQEKDRQLEEGVRRLQERNRQLADAQRQLADAQQRLRRLEGWIDGLKKSATWRWFARHTIGRREMP